MSKMDQCSVEGCNAPINSVGARGSRGFCNPHYRRWLAHGDPLAGKIARGTTSRFLHDVVLKYDGDDCLFWPFSKKVFGYGQIKAGGKNHLVHRVVCESVHGPAPSSSHQASHSCGNGHMGCVARRHLSWKTPSENSIDKFEHGTVLLGERHPGSKLSSTEVLEIKSLIGILQQKDIAKKYKVSAATIRKIEKREAWSWLSCDKRQSQVL